MKHLFQQAIVRSLALLGYRISLAVPPDLDGTTVQTIAQVRPFTMTTAERLDALIRSVEYVVQNRIPGDIVECGVWKGGSMMAVAHTLMRIGVTDRRLYLFDTFQGMSEPSEVDRTRSNEAAADLLRKSDKADPASLWCCCGVEEVKRNMLSTGYPLEQILFVQGKVEDTIPAHAPECISLLRLDTDWYQSTYHELIHCYPRLTAGGVLIIDDYGFWRGARRAVDQYIQENQPRLLLTRIDSTGRVAVKPG